MTHVNAVRPLRADNARPPPGQSSRIEEGGSDEGTNERDERDVDYSPTNHGGEDAQDDLDDLFGNEDVKTAAEDDGENEPGEAVPPDSEEFKCSPCNERIGAVARAGAGR